jgi:hypothetical protein
VKSAMKSEILCYVTSCLEYTRTSEWPRSQHISISPQHSTLPIKPVPVDPVWYDMVWYKGVCPLGLSISWSIILFSYNHPCAPIHRSMAYSYRLLTYSSTYSSPPPPPPPPCLAALALQMSSTRRSKHADYVILAELRRNMLT